MAVGEPDLRSSGDGNGVGDQPGFDTVRRGFAPDQVTDYLQRLATSALSLEARLEETRNELLQTRRERDQARAELEAAMRRDPYEDLPDRVIELIRTFDERVKQLHREAEAEADRMLAEVRSEADRILGHAREEAEAIVSEARAERERIRIEAQAVEQEAEIAAARMIEDARDRTERQQVGLTALQESTIETFRDIRERTLAALGEVEAVIERGAASDPVVVLDEAEDLQPTDVPEAP